MIRWYRRWQLRRARERYAYWKAQKEGMERMGQLHCMFNDHVYGRACGKTAVFEERVENLMREL